MGVVWATAGMAVAGVFIGEGLGATLLGGAVGGAITGVAGLGLYDYLEGKTATPRQVEEAAFFGAVFGIAGGCGEYATSDEDWAAGGLGLNSIDDVTAQAIFDS